MFTVKLWDFETMNDLKKLIKAEGAILFKDTDACSIRIYKALSAIGDILHTNDYEMLGSNLVVRDVFPVLDPELVHIVIEHPREISRKKRRRTDDILESWRSKRPKTHLPSVDELQGVLEAPLLDSEKILIPETYYNTLITAFPDTCDESDIGTLFAIGEPDPPLSFFYVVVSEPLPDDATEDAFHRFWDDNIRRALKFLLPAGKAIRNSNQHSETRNLRPDFAFILKRICVFRGEEQDPCSRESPKAELVEKLCWVYEPAPYVLGYYCEGYQLTLVAIIAPEYPGSKPKVRELISLGLKLRRNRIANLRHIINLSNILSQLADIVQVSADDFQTFEGSNSTVEIAGFRIIKTYTCKNAEDKIEHVKRIYEALALWKVPNTDMLVHINKNVTHFMPRGIAGQPTSEKELRECIACILESLDVAHRIPKYHRDIRWDNVIRRIDDRSKWFLIDWEDASGTPTMAQPTFASETHSPAIFGDGHAGEVDIWGVGYLIKTCAAVDISKEFRNLGQQICDKSRSLKVPNVLGFIATQ
ncbi:hypothetical protein BDN70DRAFT_833598 [Pholiota conissans]|uniref:Protein kinase domain-containing protein n=1 Tax=Pholiota conissans TaxID=109636 RepID=A0A9P5Z2N1_9AGAR|nr:hypothetical protein BDN70DRAFT_833598 [Pholiota conissans]